MNRLHVPISKITALLLAGGLAAAPLGALAANAHGPTLWFFGSRLIFGDSRPQMDDIAVSSKDPGLARFLSKLGATIAFQSGQRYVVVTGADHRSVTYTVGSSEYVADTRTQSAPFATVEEDGDAYIPFFTLARALNVVPVQTGEDTVLQPEIADVETQVDHGRTVIIFHGAAMLKPQLVSSTPTRLIVRFPGTSSTLQAERDLAVPGISHMSVAVSGPVRNPMTTVTLTSMRPTHLGFLPAPDATSAVLAVAPANTPLHAASAPPVAAQQPSIAAAPLPVQRPTSPRPPVSAAPAPIAAPAVSNSALAVTSVSESAVPGRFMVKLAVNGAPEYSWRILSDGRFYIDVRNANLQAPEQDQAFNNSQVASLRVRSNGTPDVPNVRLAMTLRQSPSVAVTTEPGSINLTVSGTNVANVLRAGAGRVGQDQVVAENPLLVAPVAQLPTTANPGWKFGANSAPLSNNRLIVIDPGHGGSDSGAQHNGLTEKVLTLDIARRMRTLLVARGWQVKLTRDSDVDVYQPNDSAHDELQARCDIANQAGARLFVSIHINSFTSPDLQGTTTYYYRPQDAGFASAVESKMIASLGTQNDGIQHANFYVIHHTTMPAILVETAFLSNPDDAARLRSETFRQTVASSISDGIATYASTTRPSVRGANDDSALGSSYVAPVSHAKPRNGTLVRSQSATDDDLSQ